jgi:hypothetical protein
MKIAALNRSFSDIFQNQRTGWHLSIGSRAGLNQGKIQQRRVQPATLLQPRGGRDRGPELKVEDIKVSSDRKYMYCQGCVRSQGSQFRSNVVVAVEWLDEDRKALNTDWKRVELDGNGETAALLPDAGRPFMVKARLDRRVKSVKAYAFTGSR